MSRYAAMVGVVLLWAVTPALADAGASEAVYRRVADQEAARAGVPSDIVKAVIAIESAYDPTRVGAVGEIGLMQVRPATAALLGFQGSEAELAKPEVNIHFGVAYLAQAWRLAGGDLCRALMKYRAGHGEETISPLSALYCQRARAVLAGTGWREVLGSAAANRMPFDTTVEARSPGPAIPSLPRPPRFRRGVSEAAFRSARAAYVKLLVAQLDTHRQQREAMLRRLNAPFLARVQAD